MAAAAVRRRVWLRRIALAGWIAAGVLAVWLAPRGGPLRPDMAAKVYGDSPSMDSSAPDGLFAFAETLRRLGYRVLANRRVGAPDADALVSLQPRTPLATEEVDALLAWLRRGGRLIYQPAPLAAVAGATSSAGAPAHTGAPAAKNAAANSDGAKTAAAKRTAPKTPTQNSSAAKPLAPARSAAKRATTKPATPRASAAASIEDAVVTAVRAAGVAMPLAKRMPTSGQTTPLPAASRAENAEPAAVRPLARIELWRVGRGFAALLPAESDVLTNTHLRNAGLVGQLRWLRPVLDDAHSVAFDELRLGFASGRGAGTLLLTSRFGTAITLALLALGLWLLARGRRRQPALEERPAGGRDLGEHLDAVGGLLQRTGRVQLAGRLLVDGTTSRLGGLADGPACHATLGAARTALEAHPTAVELLRQAQRLQRVEARAHAGTWTP